ncbi:sigma-54 interaction domain-containing protein [Entomomonas asaccharolytica]|uniref:Sigma-54-dependent Fis family transcriptional regulator n=1 Tax=Entomomonas asaccharolytica TaxID=2785331 RepID=A0A974RZF8_9GAMM|nr:sigma-54 dependent transcriptional regulator [Entomomonas asaccharolytica]QQP87034.1 sigma-54-dependent Fis family transcriptional regulator [Entomomonas asaccharolytica]
MQLFNLPYSPALATSIRATAQTFEDPKSKELLAYLQQIAPSEASVLIIGETGTGKELVARHIHQLSERHKGPFIAVNCGAFAETLVEAELFGQNKGAFTGAVIDKAGWFEEANGGTLFLDEIGDLPLSIQVKLLRVLQEREVVRLGSRKSIAIDVRVVAATNVELEKAIIAGNFREDLYYRINVAHLKLPPLRERKGDILPLANYFIAEYAKRLGKQIIILDKTAEKKLSSHTWPGNIRELENVIHHTLLICQSNVISEQDLHFSSLPLKQQTSSNSIEDIAIEELLAKTFERLFNEQPENIYQLVEKALFHTAYDYSFHNQVHTAQLLGISRNIVRAKLIEYGDLVVNKRANNSE